MSRSRPGPVLLLVVGLLGAGLVIEAAQARTAPEEQEEQQEQEEQETGREPAPGRAPSERMIQELMERGLPAGSQWIFDDIPDIEDVANDLFVWAWIPTLSGTIGDNAYVGGQRITVASDAEILGDLFLFAQTAQIHGTVQGDVYLFSADVTVGESGSIGGSVYGSAAAFTVDGTVRGPVTMAVGGLVVNGTLGGDVQVEVGELVVGPGARIEGDVVYRSPTEADVDPGATVVGEMRHEVPEAPGDEEVAPAATGGWSWWSFAWKAWLYLGSFVVGAVLMALLGDTARRPARALVRQPAQGLGFGFLVAVVLPAGALLALFFVITIPLAMITFVLYAVALYVARLVAAQAAGDLLVRVARSGVEPSGYLSLALGLALFYLLLEVPFVGFLTHLVAFVAGLGGIYLGFRSRDRGEDTASSPASGAEAGGTV